MVDFTGIPDPIIQAAYNRGKEEGEKERMSILMALVDALYDDEKRAVIRKRLEEAYGLAEENAIVVDL